MVLPPPAADDASGPPVSSWLRRLTVSLRLSRAGAGLLVLVDHARPERLGELVRVLYAVDPDAEVHTEAHKLLEVRPGSMLVLVPRAEDADWLNLNRPLFSSRALRVVLFCTREVSVVLSRRAVDLIDWASLRLECPEGPAPYAVAGLRTALAARMPGVVWTGGDLEASFAAARPRRKLRRVSAARPYEELVAEAKADRAEWLAWTEVEGDFRLRRVRWALAEAGRRTRTVLLEPSVRSPGWWEAHGRVADLREARERLAQAGAEFPGRLAALVDLEPEAISLLVGLMGRGMGERSLQEELLKTTDPGAALGRLAATHALVSEQDLTRGRAPPPAMRAFGVERRMRLLQREELVALEQRLVRAEQVDAEDVAWWAAWARTQFAWEKREEIWERGEVAEALLRLCPRTGETWAKVASLAQSAGDLDVAYAWAQRAAAAMPAGWIILSQVLTAQGRLAEAESILRHHLTAGTQVPDAERGRILYDLGSVLERQGRYTEAEERLRQALSLDEQAPGPKSLSYGASLNGLARVLERQGRYAEAEKLLRQALAIIAQELGSRHVNYGASLHNLARVLESQGQYAEAENLLRQANIIIEQQLGPQSPDYGASLRNLASVLERQGKYAEAERLLRQALAIHEKTVGPQHPDYGTSLHELARMLGQQGQYAEAEKLLRQALIILKQTLGSRHPAYSTSIHELARMLELQGHFAEAEQLLRQVLEIRAQTLGPQHPAYGTSLHTLATVLDSQGRFTESEKVLRQSLAIQEQTLGPQHPRICPTLANLGFNLAKQGRPQEGEPFLLRAIDIARETWEPAHPVTAQILSLLATVQAALNKPDAATTAQQAMDALLHALGPDHPSTKALLPALSRIAAG